MNLLDWFRDAPIKRKLVLVGLLMPAVALLVVSLILTAKDVFEWRGRTVSELTSYAKVIGSNAAPALLFDDRIAAIETLSALSVRPDIVHAVIYDRNGNVFAVYDNRSTHRDYSPAIEPGEHLFTLDYLAISHAIHFKNDTLGSIYIESNLRGLYAGILRSVGLIFLTAFGVFLLAAVLFARLQKIILAPIVDMSGAMRRVISEQDFAVRVAFQGKDEVGALAETFNVMLEHIHQRDAELMEHREHLEEQVAQRTAGLTEAQRIAHLGSFDWNVVSGALQWTAEHFRLWGLEPYAVMPDYELFRQGLHPDDAARVEEALQQALHGGRPYDCEHRVLARWQHASYPRPRRGDLRRCRASGQDDRNGAGHHRIQAGRTGHAHRRYRIREPGRHHDRGSRWPHRPGQRRLYPSDRLQRRGGDRTDARHAPVRPAG